jgi:hypothetical protein
MDAERLAEIRALLRRWSDERKVVPGGHPAPSSYVADAGLELLASFDTLAADLAAERARAAHLLAAGREWVAASDAEAVVIDSEDDDWPSRMTKAHLRRQVAEEALRRALAPRAGGDGEGT